MDEEGRAYFGGIIRLRTPRQFPGQDDNSFDEMCEEYCRIKNLARDVLLPPYLNPEITKSLIEEKLKKIERLSGEK